MTDPVSLHTIYPNRRKEAAMKKVGIIIGVVVVIIVVIAIIASGNGSPAENGVPGLETFSPVTFTGTSDKTTSPFEVTTSEWIVDWSYVPDPEYPEYAVFQFFVYPRGETVNFVEAMISPGDTNGSTYSYAGSGEYYIKVYCGNVDSWEITIRPPP